MRFLLDTNVLSELLRKEPDPRVIDWLARQDATQLLVSTVTQAEMLLGARLLPAGRRRSELERALDAMFEQDFAGRLLPFDAAAARVYATIVVSRRAKGRPISQSDAQIAAIAMHRGCAVVTRNVDDFTDCHVTVIDPWQVNH
jgi:predicted nucleic acid-binding protein